MRRDLGGMVADAFVGGGDCDGGYLGGGDVNHGDESIFVSGANRIEWSGVLSASAPLTITFGVTVTASGSQTIVNTATITDGVSSLTVSATTIVKEFSVYLPVVLRTW